MNRIIFGIGIALACAPCPSIADSTPPRPNIVLIMCDDLGWGDVGFNGNTVIRTPCLDEMASAGMKFNRFYAAAPVCSPTRASCLTGRHPYRQGIFFANSGHLPERESTLAEILRKQGYATAHFGKWHLGTLSKTVVESNRGGPRRAEHFSPPWKNGFDHCFSTESRVPTWDPMLMPRMGNQQTWWEPITDASEAVPFGTYYWTNGKQATENLKGADPRIIMDRVIPFVEDTAKKDKSFLAVVWFHSPHLPVVAGSEYTKPYAEHDPYARHYYGAITAMDEQVGRLRQAIRALDVAENTILLFCSDNGPEGEDGLAPGSAGPFRGRKRSLYEGGVRVPAILEWPSRIESGQVSDYPACTSDYLPTLLDILGLEPSELVEPLDGISLLPGIEGRTDERPRPICFESEGQLALTDNQYKLIHVPDSQGEREKTPVEDLDFELYDLIADPGETNDLAGEHLDLVRQMASELAKWQRSCDTSRTGADY